MYLQNQNFIFVLDLIFDMINIYYIFYMKQIFVCVTLLDIIATLKV